MFSEDTRVQLHSQLLHCIHIFMKRLDFRGGGRLRKERAVEGVPHMIRLITYDIFCRIDIIFC